MPLQRLLAVAVLAAASSVASGCGGDASGGRQLAQPAPDALEDALVDGRVIGLETPVALAHCSNGSSSGSGDPLFPCEVKYDPAGPMRKICVSLDSASTSFIVQDRPNCY